MEIVMRVFCDDEHFDNFPPYAIVDITPSRAGLASSRIDRVAILDQMFPEDEVFSIEFWDGSPVFVDSLDLDEATEAALYGGPGYAELPASMLDDDLDEVYIASGVMVVLDDAVLWAGYVPKTPYEIRTAVLTRDEIVRLAAPG